MKTIIMGLAVLAFSTAGVVRGEEVDERKSAEPDGRVHIENVSGSIVVIGWDRDEIHVQGELGRGTERLDFDVDGSRARIKVVLPRRARNVDGSDLEIRVPKGSRVEVETVSASIDVEELTAALSLESVSGDITIRGEPGELSAATVSGDIDCDAKTDETELSTVSGSIEARGLRGRLEAASVSGDVDVYGDDFDRLAVETVSGLVRFEGRLNEDARVEGESHSGDIVLTLVGDVDAEFDVSTFSGSIRNEIGREDGRSRRRGPGSELHFTVGDGSAHVNLSSFSGTVELRTD